MTDSTNGKKIQSFSNWSPRVSATYDLFGNGKTLGPRQRLVLLRRRRSRWPTRSAACSRRPALTLGHRTSRAAPAARPRRGCWTDANLDGLVQANELTGDAERRAARGSSNGVLLPAGNIVDPSAKIGRTREAIVGMQHELIPNLAVGVDYIYRKYDRGTTTYTIGYQPGAPGFPLSAIYVPADLHRSGHRPERALLHGLRDGCSRPSGLGNITVTNPNYQIYKGVDLTATKRFSNRWQMATSLTIQDNPQYFPRGVGARSSTRRASSSSTGISTIAQVPVQGAGQLHRSRGTSTSPATST